MKKIDYTKIINYLIIFYAFSLPLSRAALSGVGVLLFVLWLLDGNLRQKYLSLKKSKVVIYLFLLILLSYISLIWTQQGDLLYGLNVASKTLRIVFLPLIVIATTLKKEYIPKVITSFLLGMLLSEILSYGIFFGWWTLHHGTPLNPTPFMYHIDYSVFLAFTSLLLLNKILHEQNLKYRLIYIAYFTSVTINLFINGGRTGQMAFIVTIFIFGMFKIKNKLFAFFSTLTFISLLLSVAYTFSPVFKLRVDAGISDIKKMQEKDYHYQGSLGERVGFYDLGYHIIKQNPLLGVGIGSMITSMQKEGRKNIKRYKELLRYGSLHNVYLDQLAKLGILGLFLYIMIWYQLYKIKIKEKFFSDLKLIFISVICISSITEVLFVNQFPMNLMALFMGIFLVLEKKESS